MRLNQGVCVVLLSFFIGFSACKKKPSQNIAQPITGDVWIGTASGDRIFPIAARIKGRWIGQRQMTAPEGIEVSETSSGVEKQKEFIQTPRDWTIFSKDGSRRDVKVETAIDSKTSEEGCYSPWELKVSASESPIAGIAMHGQGRPQLLEKLPHSSPEASKLLKTIETLWLDHEDHVKPDLSEKKTFIYSLGHSLDNDPLFYFLTPHLPPGKGEPMEESTVIYLQGFLELKGQTIRSFEVISSNDKTVVKIENKNPIARFLIDGVPWFLTSNDGYEWMSYGLYELKKKGFGAAVEGAYAGGGC